MKGKEKVKTGKTEKAATVKKGTAGTVEKRDQADRPKEFSVTIYNSEGKEVGKFELDKNIFTGEVDNDVLYQAVIMYGARKRQGNASTKTRGDVSGGGKKPWRQKGTGRARAGSIRSPLWRGGGTVFGPHPRDYHYNIPLKVRRKALLSSINSKLNENRIIGIDSIKLDEAKTKKFKSIMDALKLKGKSLFILDSADANIMRASRNIGQVVIRNYRDFNTMDIMACDNMVMSKISLENLGERVGGPA
jgi:large subunit ribosomal protein L4